MAAAHNVQALLSSLGSAGRLGSLGKLRPCVLPGADGEDGAPARETEPLALAWPGLGDLLPDGGLPRGVVELASPHALGGATSFALEAIRAGQSRSSAAWCAWIDPEGTLHAPGVVAAGVDLGRLLVVHPPRAELGRVAVKVLGASAFEVVVVDYDAVPGARASTRTGPPSEPDRARKKAWAPEVLVRKLALSAESSGATVLLLTDSTKPRSMQWPVALRLELARPRRDDLVVRIAKDRRGRIGSVKTLPFAPLVKHATKSAG